MGVGGFGDHYYTVDTGKTWTLLPPLTGNLVNKIYGLNNTLWVTGSYGTILRSGFLGSIQRKYAVQLCNGDSVQIGNNWISKAGTFRDTLFGACDTIIEANVQLRTGGQSNAQVTLCSGDSIFAGGAYRTTSGTFQDTYTNSWGCDSVVTLNVTVNNSNLTVIQNGLLLTAVESNATYQWFDCQSATPISGATNRSYAVATSGDYAVIIMKNGCSDTSACYTLMVTGIPENSFGSKFTLHPNPTNGNVSVQIDNPSHYSIDLMVYSMKGQLLLEKRIEPNIQEFTTELDLSNGSYFYRLSSRGVIKSGILMITK